MAVIKLGSIITDIAGSVGGTTFRRIKNGHQMYNKPIGAARGRLLNNPALIVLNKIATTWQSLTTSQRQAWIDAALLFQFPNKFGVQVNITGYQLYIKNTNFNKAVNGPDLNPATFSSSVLTTSIAGEALDFFDYAAIELTSTLLNTYAIVQCYSVSNFNVAPVYLNYKVLKTQNITSNKLIVFTSEFNAQFPNQLVDQFFYIVVTFQNVSGFRSSPISVITQVAAS